VNKCLEYTLIGIGGLLFFGILATILLLPVVGIVWLYIVYIVPQWTDLHTFGAIIFVGLISLAWLFSK